MAGFRKPGPIGLEPETQSLNDGTNARYRSPLPGSIGMDVNPDTSSDSRSLTAGEISMVKSIFQDSIDCKMVKIHNREYLWFGFQPDDTAMTPNGEIYFNPKHFKLDFSKGSKMYKLWFMHEMVHVWQYQLGYSVKWAGLKTDYSSKKVYEYDAEIDAGKTLADFNFEQQGDLIKDYYGAKFLDFDPLGKKSFLESVLSTFLKDPKDAKLLPK